MVEINTTDVIKLRKLTATGVMDCKQALQEAEGNFEKAIEIIRKKGKAIATKRADREASEGVALAKVTEDGSRGAIVVLNCETDFVAKNQDFIAITQNILDIALEKNPLNIEELKTLKIGTITIAEKILEQMAVIGEKIDLKYYDKIESPGVVAYVHQGNKLATIVGFNKKGIDLQVMKDLAMQVTAMDPVAIDKDDVPAEVLEKEIEIGKEQARNEGKPENLLEKIAMGKLNKFYIEKTLMNQEFIKDNKMNIRTYLQNTDKDLKITSFKRYSLNL